MIRATRRCARDARARRPIPRAASPAIMPPRDLEAATMGGADHPTTRKKRTQTVAWAALLVFVALLQLLVYHMHSVRHHVGSFGRSARERERVVLPRGGDDDGDGWALVGGDGRGDGGRVGEGDEWGGHVEIKIKWRGRWRWSRV